MYESISGLFCSIDLQCAEVPISPHPNQKLLLSVFFFLNIAILISVKSYPIVVLICISLKLMMLASG